MTRHELNAMLAAGEIVPMTGRQWERLAGAFEVVDTHDTKVAGELLIVRGEPGLAAVERPKRSGRVIRPLKDEAHARRFVAARLEAYDRFWDG